MLVSLCLSFSWGSLRGQCMVIMDSFALNRDPFSVTNSTHGYVGNYEQVDLSPDWKAARMEWEREEESFRRSPREPQRRHEVPASSTALNRSALRWPDSTAQLGRPHSELGHLVPQVGRIFVIRKSTWPCGSQTKSAGRNWNF